MGFDAVQVYRGLDAATAKPPREQRERVRHHVLDCIDPRTDFSLAAFLALAEQALDEIRSRRAPAILAGGTGLYLRGLLRGIVPAPPRDARLRARLHALAERRGPAALHRLLARIDPESARRLSPSDAQRVARAVEFGLLAGEPFSARLAGTGTWASGRERFATLKVGLTLERAELYARLDRRVEAFFAGGLVEEVERLLVAGLPPGANALKAIGYREVAAALASGGDPRAVVEDVKRNTRRYAKRQLTWFRGEPEVVWFDAGAGIPPLVDAVLARWRGVAESR